MIELLDHKLWPYYYGHMKTYIKATYSLDPITMREVDVLAKSWGVPKSEVIRRSVQFAMDKQDESKPLQLTRKQALDYLQSESRLSAEQRAEWIREIRAERHSR